MKDDPLRELMGRYRPVAPDAGLRQRALSLMPRPQRTWPWAAAAAALLVASVAIHEASSRTLSSYATTGDTSESVEALAEALGGDEDARRAAEWIVADRQWRTQHSVDAAGNRDEVNSGEY